MNVNLPQGICTDEAGDVNRVGSDHRALMRLAVCMQKNNHPAAIDLYHHIRRSTPDYSYVLVNIGVHALKSGDVYNARMYLEQYLNEVGGPYGNEIPVDKPPRKEALHVGRMLQERSIVSTH